MHSLFPGRVSAPSHPLDGRETAVPPAEQARSAKRRRRGMQFPRRTRTAKPQARAGRAAGLRCADPRARKQPRYTIPRRIAASTASDRVQLAASEGPNRRCAGYRRGGVFVVFDKVYERSGIRAALLDGHEADGVRLLHFDVAAVHDKKVILVVHLEQRDLVAGMIGHGKVPVIREQGNVLGIVSADGQG